MSKLYSKLSEIIQRYGNHENEGYWVLHMGFIEVFYEISWFIDHSVYNFGIKVFKKIIFYKSFDGIILDW